MVTKRSTSLLQRSLRTGRGCNRFNVKRKNAFPCSETAGPSPHRPQADRHAPVHDGARWSKPSVALLHLSQTERVPFEKNLETSIATTGGAALSKIRIGYQMANGEHLTAVENGPRVEIRMSGIQTHAHCQKRRPQRPRARTERICFVGQRTSRTAGDLHKTPRREGIPETAWMNSQVLRK